MVYKYRLYVANKNSHIIKNFLGNDKNELMERYEVWVTKQGVDRNELTASIDQVQHARY